MKTTARLIVLASLLWVSGVATAAETPNIVVIFIDDMGYADIGPFGAKGYPTPNLDRMAREGMRFTDFQVSSAVCSASRAALMTGCYHRRVGISGALGPKSRIGISNSEVTIAEICKQKGYATACYGKWHLGHHTQFLPLQHGFDDYFGLPYSNDMWPYHPNVLNLPMAKRLERWPHLPLIDKNKVVNGQVTGKDQEQLTTQYTERAVAFIAQNKHRPFFLYVPHSMVHVPLYVSDKFRGKSQAGLFGDVVMEVDWSVGQILAALREHNLDKNSLVIFTADNGPWLSYGDHAGSAGPLREGKGTMFEGGCREPTLMRWLGRIPAGTNCDELASTIDILPTVADLIGAELPEHKIDGKNISRLMFGEAGATSPHEAFYSYYGGGGLQAVRDRRWKLHFPHSYRTLDGKPGGKGGLPVAYGQANIGLELFDLKSDVSESTNVAAKYADVVSRLQRHAERARDDLGDRLTDRRGRGVREPGRLESPGIGAANRPNIILCMGDDHGWDETAYNGHPHLKTPVLDQMASSGLRLDRFYSAHPSCSPTRGSVITGRHPNRYGTFAPNYSIRPEEISIAQILHKSGYACGHFGKWHLGPVKAESPVNPAAMGFDEWLSHDNFFELDPYLSRNGGPPQKFPGESSEIIIDETIRFIGKAAQNDQPYFAVVWFGSPHEPYAGLDMDLALYDDLPESYRERSVRLTSIQTGLPVNRPLVEVLRERYAEITAMDRAIGKLRRFLDEKGQRQNTLLWYCGDNGVPTSGRVTTPFRGQKGLVYEGGIRVPGIIEWPSRIQQPRVSAVNAVTTDMLPTICDLIGQPLPERPLDGVSLAALINGRMARRPRPICFWNYNASRLANKGLEPYIDLKLQEGTTPLVKKMNGRLTRNFRNFHQPEITEQDFTGPRAILDNRYKFVVNGQSGDEADKELFDLRQDQAESNNIIATKPEIAKDLEQQLRAWQESVLSSLTGADYQ